MVVVVEVSSLLVLGVGRGVCLGVCVCVCVCACVGVLGLLLRFPEDVDFGFGFVFAFGFGFDFGLGLGFGSLTYASSPFLPIPLTLSGSPERSVEEKLLLLFRRRGCVCVMLGRSRMDGSWMFLLACSLAGLLACLPGFFLSV